MVIVNVVKEPYLLKYAKRLWGLIVATCLVDQSLW